jgi:hypothetical protein
MEQCSLYAVCLASFSTKSCKSGRPRRISNAAAGVVLIQPDIPKQVMSGYGQTGFLQWFVNIGLITEVYMQYDPMFFQLLCGIASKYAILVF